jgi:hypothetical protein
MTTLRATAEELVNQYCDFLDNLSQGESPRATLVEWIHRALQAQVEACAKKVCAYCDMGVPHKDLEFHENKTAAGWRKRSAMPQFVKCDAAAIRAMKGSKP